MSLTLPQILFERALHRPEQIAYVLYPSPGENETEIQCGELQAGASLVAAMLKDQGVQPGDRILLPVSSAGTFIKSFFGCMYAGGIPVPTPPKLVRHDVDRLQVIARDCLAKFVLADYVASTEPELGLRWLSIDQANGTDWRDHQLNISAEPQSVAYLQYTSGSTSQPKGVMISHANVINNLEAIQEDFQHTKDSVAVNWLPLYHDMGLVYGLLAPLRYAFKGVLMSPFSFVRNPLLWLKAISDWGGTHSGGPDSAYQDCVNRIQDQECDGVRLESWRVAFNGSERVRASTLQNFAEKFSKSGFSASSFYACYGLAEATLKVSGGRPYCSSSRTCSPNSGVVPTGVHQEHVSCGRPSLETTVKIVDPHTRVPCADSVVGEVWVEGPGVGLGYWSSSMLSKKTFRAREKGPSLSTYLRTGDLGFLQQNELYVVGRLKDLVIINGTNYYPDDIEASVRMVVPPARPNSIAAFSVDLGDREGLVIVHAPAGRNRPDYDDLAEKIKRVVAEDFGIPLYALVFVRTSTIPLSSSGKIRRHKCREMFCEDRLKSDARFEWPPSKMPLRSRTEPEISSLAWLSQQVARLTGCSSIDPDLPLISQGIDSLKAGQLCQLVSERWGVELDIAAVLEARQPFQLAGLLSDPQRRVHRDPAVRMDSAESLLSSEERRLWYLHAFHPRPGALTLAASVLIKGKLNIGTLKSALNRLVSRHPNLRARFPGKQGVPLRCVDAETRSPLPVIDLNLLSPSSKVSETSRCFQWVTARALDVERGPLWGCTLMQLDQDEAILLIHMHHLVGDAESFGVFFSELMQLYAGNSAVLPVASSQGTLRDIVSHSDREFWRASLAGANTPWPEHHSASGGSSCQVNTRLDPHFLERVKAISVENGVTSFVVLLSAFYMLLREKAGIDDVTILCPFSQRSIQGDASVIGSLSVPLPVRLNLGREYSAKKILREVAKVVRQCLSHQSTSLAEVAEIVGANRKWPILFSCLVDPIGELNTGGLWCSPGPLRKFTSDLPLSVNLLISAKQGEGVLLYDNTCVPSALVESFWDSYIALLADFSETGVQDIAEPSVQAEPAITVAATFTADGLSTNLKFWSDFLGMPWSYKFTTINQVFQDLIDPSSLLRSTRLGVNAVLIRFADWCHFDVRLNGRDLAIHLTQAADEFVAVVRNASALCHVPLLIVICPESETLSLGDNEVSPLRQAQDSVASGLAGVSGVCVLTWSELVELYPTTEWQDRFSDQLATIPYTQEFFAVLGAVIARFAFDVLSPPYKAIAVDCDGTLWLGSAGESAPQNLTLDSSRRRLQELLLAHSSAGVLLCLCSKNYESSVLEVFRQRPDMPLRLEHFVSRKVNWEAKAKNLRTLAQELDLSIDSFIFIDDDAHECAEMTDLCPEVLCAQLPQTGKEVSRFLSHLWPIQPLYRPYRNLDRSSQYRREIERKSILEQSTDIAEFVGRLQLNVRIAEAQEGEIERLSELSMRVNQFNATGERYSPGILKEYGCRHQVYSVDASDRFGDYGLVGLILCHPSDNVLFVDNLLLSCRALGRSVEHRMVNWLGAQARAQGCDCIKFRFRNTGRNRQAQELFRTLEHGVNIASFDERLVSIHSGAAEAFSVQTSSGEPDQTSDLAGRVADEPSSHVPGRLVHPGKLLEIANSLYDGPSLLKRVREYMGVVSADNKVKGNGSVEDRITEIWLEVLGAKSVGQQDDFFKSGGTSLSAMELLARLSDTFGVKVPISILFSQELTIANLIALLKASEYSAGTTSYLTPEIV